MTDTRTIDQLTKVPGALRDEKWETKFFQEFCLSNVKLLSQDPQTGPDNWPYLLAEVTPDATEPSTKIIQWLSERGIGLVVNPHKDFPDYIFTYGMIWSFRETGLFFRNEMQDEGVFDLDATKIEHSGDASKEYLPPYARQILKDFFRDQGSHAVKILVFSFDKKTYEFGVSLESLGNPPQSEHPGIAEAISWFLPPHYSIVLVSEKGMPKFFDL